MTEEEKENVKDRIYFCITSCVEYDKEAPHVDDYYYVDEDYYEPPYDIVSVQTPDKTGLTVSVTSKPSSYPMPDSITVELIADGEDTGRTVVLSASNKWTHTFTGLDPNQNDREIEYDVIEELTEEELVEEEIEEPAEAILKEPVEDETIEEMVDEPLDEWQEECYNKYYNKLEEYTEKKLEETVNQMEKLNINPDDFDDMQLHKIAEGIYKIKPVENVLLYANPKFNGSQMESIEYGLLPGSRLSIEEVKSYADEKFDGEQMWIICEGYQNDKIRPNIDIYFDPKYDADRMEEAFDELKDGFAPEDVSDIMTDTDLTVNDMKAIRENVKYKHINLMEAKAIIKNTKNVLADIVDEKVKINALSRWDVSVESSDYNFDDVYYNIQTDSGNFEVRAALSDPYCIPVSDNIKRILVWTDTESLNEKYPSVTAKSMRLYSGGYWWEEKEPTDPPTKEQKEYTTICNLLDTVYYNDRNPDDAQQIIIFEESDPNSDSSFFHFCINEQEILVSDAYNASIDVGDTFAKFCEDHKEAVLRLAERCRADQNEILKTDYDGFKHAIYSNEITETLSDGNENKQQKSTEKRSGRFVPSNFEKITEQAEKEEDKKDKTKEESPVD